MIKSLIIGELNNIKFENNEKLIVIENYYKDFYQKKNIKNDISIVKPFLLNKSKKILTFKKCENIYSNILKDISKSLNKLHKVNFNTRSWEIIFGNWLRFFVWACFERYKNLEFILRQNNIKKIYFLRDKKYSSTANQESDMYYSSIDDKWNSNLYFEIFNYLSINKNKDIKVLTQNFYSNSEEDFLFKKKDNSKVNFYKKFLKFFSIFQSENDGIILTTYLSPIYEKIFEILFFQAPRHWDFEKIVFKKFDSLLRSKIDISRGKKKNIENFIRKNVQNFLPKSLIESFSNILEMSKKAGFPKNPKFIFTSNDFEGNEIFKFYTANLLMKKKIPYIIGQHGNTYFTDLRVDKYRSEFNFSDKFFTYGYSKSTKFKGLFNFSSYGRKKYKSQKKKKLLIIVSPLEFRAFPFSNTAEIELGFTNVLDILQSVNKKISKNTTIRLGNSYDSKRGKYYLSKYFKKKSLNIDMGKDTFVKARFNSRLCFFNYDSSGILENLALNFPTVCLWDNIEDNISDKFFFKYKFLIKAKILFLDKNDLIDHLDHIWNNVDNWWLSENTQKYVNKFNEKFNIQGDYTSLFKLKKNCLENYEKNIL